MKFVKNLFYILMILLLAGSVGILLCATNPEMTNSLAAILYGTENMDGLFAGKPSKNPSDVPENPGIDQSGNSDHLDTVDSGLSQPADQLFPEEAESDSSHTDSSQQIPIATIPSIVDGKNGYEPIDPTEEQITDKIADNLSKNVGTGPLGEDYQFDELFYPFYYMLNSAQQSLYRQIYANAMEVKASFAPAKTITVDLVKDTFEAVVNDHPELFYLQTGYSVKYTQTGRVVEIALSYYTFTNDLSQAKDLFDSSAESIVQMAKNTASVYDKERFVHNALISLAEYDDSAKWGQSAYGVLVDRASVCAGYARAFQYIMQRLGVPCYYCTGFSGESHAWNIIQIGDGFLNVDVTWDDTIPATYDFFNCTDEMYAGTHIRKGLSVNLPPCGASEYAGLEQQKSPELTEDEADSLAALLASGEIPERNPLMDRPLSYDKDRTKLPQSNDDKDKQDSSGTNGDSNGNADNKNDSNQAEISPEDIALSELGLARDDVAWSIEDYYKTCLEKMVALASENQHFYVIIPENLYRNVESDYGLGVQEKEYLNEVMKKLGKTQYDMQLQVQRLGKGFYKIYHNVSLW